MQQGETRRLSSTDQRKFEALLSQLSDLKQELSRERIVELIQEKKKRVGGGYLTDQGALFLVATDNGVTLNYEESASASLVDITPDLQSVNLKAKVITFGPARVFTRKGDSGRGLLSRLVVYDQTLVCSVSLWDSKAVLPTTIELSPGDMISITNAYSRTGLDGGVVLNIGEKGAIEKIPDDKSIPPVMNRAVPIDVILEPARSLAVKCVVKTRANRNTFNRSDGTSGSLVSFSIGSETQLELEMRVVIWENANPVFLNLAVGEKITLLSVRSKQGRDPGASSMELHGDETTAVLEYSAETLHWLKKSNEQSFASEPSNSTESKKIAQGSPLPFVARVLSIGQRSPDGTSIRLLLIDSQKRKLSATVAKESLDDVEHLAANDLLICKPDAIDHATFKASFSRRGSLSKAGAKRVDIPDSASLIVKIESLTEGATVSLEVMSLAESVSREVQTKDGLVRRSELQVGDPTGEIRLYGWRDLSRLMDKIPVGVRMWLLAVEVQSHEGRKFLNLKNYSRIERKV